MTSKKTLFLLLLLGLPACAQVEALFPSTAQTAPRAGAAPMTVLTDRDIADMKRNEPLPRPVNYDGQRWHYATEEEKASQENVRNAPWDAQDPALRATVEDRPVEWWGTENPGKPAPRYWWDASEKETGKRVQVYDDGQGGMTTTPPAGAAAANTPTQTPNVAPRAGQAFPLPTTTCPNGVCPAGN